MAFEEEIKFKLLILKFENNTHYKIVRKKIFMINYRVFISSSNCFDFQSSHEVILCWILIFG